MVSPAGRHSCSSSMWNMCKSSSSSAALVAVIQSSGNGNHCLLQVLYNLYESELATSCKPRITVWERLDVGV